MTKAGGICEGSSEHFVFLIMSQLTIPMRQNTLTHRNQVSPSSYSEMRQLGLDTATKTMSKRIQRSVVTDISMTKRVRVELDQGPLANILIS